MQTNVRDAAVRTALTALIDYAGLFPPAKLAMHDALTEYAAARGSAHAWMLGKFIVPLSRVSELLSSLPDGECLPLSAILDGGIDGLREVARFRERETRIAIEALEIPLEPARIGEYAAALRQTGLSALPSFVEFRRDAAWEQTLAAGMPVLAAHALGAKVRCGGLEAGAFPSPRELARFIRSAADARVRFKATAGLHHPIRHYNAASGFTMHGFLNLTAAAAIARDAGVAEIEEVLACEESAQFAFDDRGFKACGHRAALEEITAARREFFVAYGSCSFGEPVEDLRALEILA
jgi:hypothetical protein